MQTATPVPRKAPRPRADALRNRERIVTAAREMFVEFGPDVPLDEVARRAGVGNATVYRNFPDRDALVREVVCSVMDRTVRAAELALADHIGGATSRSQQQLVQLQAQVEGYTSAIWFAVGILVVAAAIALTLVNAGRPGGTAVASSSDETAGEEVAVPVVVH
ncbi:hypothetical protein SGRIM128S_07982 [Streptomyces griseomycini]